MQNRNNSSIQDCRVRLWATATASLPDPVQNPSSMALAADGAGTPEHLWMSSVQPQQHPFLNVLALGPLSLVLELMLFTLLSAAILGLKGSAGNNIIKSQFSDLLI